MTDKHTPEPWVIDRYHNIIADGEQLGLGGVKCHCTWGDGMMQDRANARRVVACVNACAGITHDELLARGLQGSLLDSREQLTQQRDDLLAALEGLLWAVRSNNEGGTPKTQDQIFAEAGHAAIAAIAKARGE